MLTTQDEDLAKVEEAGQTTILVNSITENIKTIAEYEQDVT